MENDEENIVQHYMRQYLIDMGVRPEDITGPDVSQMYFAFANLPNEEDEWASPPPTPLVQNNNNNQQQLPQPAPQQPPPQPAPQINNNNNQEEDIWDYINEDQLGNFYRESPMPEPSEDSFPSVDTFSSEEQQNNNNNERRVHGCIVHYDVASPVRREYTFVTNGVWENPNGSLNLAWNPYVNHYHGRIVALNLPANSLTGRVLFDSNDPFVPRPQPNIDIFSFQTMAYLIQNSVRMVYDNMRVMFPAYGRDLRNYRIRVRFMRDGMPIRLKEIVWPRIWQGIADPYRFLVDYQSFEAVIDEMLNGESESETRIRRAQNQKRAARGLPPIIGPLLDGYDLDTSTIWTIVSGVRTDNMLPALSSSSYKFMAFKTVSHAKSKLNCIHQSLVDCGINDISYTNDSGVNVCLKSCVDIDVLCDFLTKRNLPISIIYNVPEFRDDQCAIGHNGKSILLPDAVHAKTFYPLKDEHIKPIFLFRSTAVNFILCYDVTRQHIEKISTALPQLNDRIFVDQYRIIKEFTIGNNREQVLIIRDWESLEEPELEPLNPDFTYFVFFKVRGIYEYHESEELTAYATSYAILNSDQICDLTADDDLDTESEVENQVVHISGYDSLHTFLSALFNHADVHPDFKYVLCGYGNSELENFYILNALQKQIQNNYMNVVNFVDYQGINRISNIIFYNKRITTFDIHRHLAGGNLSYAAWEFGNKRYFPQSSVINELDFQVLFIDHGRNDFLQMLKTGGLVTHIKKSCMFEVLTMAVLFGKYVTEMHSYRNVIQASRFGLKPVYCYCSMPNYLYTMGDILRRGSVKTYPLNYEMYKFIRKGTRAGRNDCFGNEGLKLQEEVVKLDMCSCYPAIMFVLKDLYFPTGRPMFGIMNDTMLQTFSFDVNNDFYIPHLGYFTVTIDQAILKEQGLPVFISLQTDGDKNNYNVNDEKVVKQEKIILSVIEIEYLIKLGVEVRFPMNEPYLVWEDKRLNYELFYWLEEFARRKIVEDSKPENERNHAVRALAKHCMNCQSGKSYQKVNELYYVQLGIHEYYSYIRRSKKLKEGSESIIGYINANKLVMQYEKKDEYLTGFKQIQWGSHIYAYSRIYMFENILKRIGQKNSLYMDTDMVAMRRVIFEEMIRPFMSQMKILVNDAIYDMDPRYHDLYMFQDGAKLIGGFENEVEGNNLFYLQAKKEYAIFRVDWNGNVGYCKYSLKGIKANALLINMSDPDVSSFIGDIDGRLQVTSQKNAARFDITHQNQRIDIPMVTKQVFEKLHTKEGVYVMYSRKDTSIVNCNVKITYSLIHKN